MFSSPFFFVSFAGLLSCRQVLNIMVILGFMLNYALRVNLTIAIVAMVEDPTTTKPTTISNFNLNATVLNANETTTNLAELVSWRFPAARAYYTERSQRQVESNLCFLFYLVHSRSTLHPNQKRANSNGTRSSETRFWAVSSGVTYWPNCLAVD